MYGSHSDMFVLFYPFLFSVEVRCLTSGSKLRGRELRSMHVFLVQTEVQTSTYSHILFERLVELSLHLDVCIVFLSDCHIALTLHSCCLCVFMVVLYVLHVMENCCRGNNR